MLLVLKSCLQAGLRPREAGGSVKVFKSLARAQVGVITGYSAQQELLQRRWAVLAKELALDPRELRVRSPKKHLKACLMSAS